MSHYFLLLLLLLALTTPTPALVLSHNNTNQCAIPPLSDRYIVIRSLGEGFFGKTEVVRRDADPNVYVKKRLKPQSYDNYDLSAVREAYFGNLFTSNSYTGRFQESFRDNENGLCLIFLYEGRSLDSLLYDQSKNRIWWKWLKTTQEGQQAMKNLILRLVKAVNSIHSINVTHADIKPENVAICPVKEKGSCSLHYKIDEYQEMFVRLIDFGSSFDDFSLKNLYGGSSPMLYVDYIAPEAYFNPHWLRGPTDRYDMWTIGVLVMEIVLGTPHVFEFPEAKDAYDRFYLMDPELIDDHVKKIIAWGDMCIFGNRLPNQVNCDDDKFDLLVKRRDPLHLGFHDPKLRNLVRELLRGDPSNRISSADALRHPYLS